MKVAIYSGTYKENQDGVTRTLYRLTDSLLKENIEVGIWSGIITPQQRHNLHLFPMVSIPVPVYPDYRISLPFWKIRRQLATFAPDVIHITVPDFTGQFLLRYAREHNIPVVCSYHTDFPAYLKYYRLQIFKKRLWNYFRWFYNQSGVVFAPTRALADQLKSQSIDPVYIWSRGIQREFFHPRFRSRDLRARWGGDEKTVILYAGRFVWYKDLQTVIEVYDLFRDAGNSSVRFVLAGDGPIRDELERRMPEAIFPGYLKGRELARVYASSDLFLFPSTTETFGNVVQEALASGCPSVVSDIGGCQEIVHESGSGLVAPARDTTAFYRACRQLIENPRLYQAKVAQGLAYADTQNWDRVNSRIIAAYTRLIENKTWRGPQQRHVLASDFQ